MDQSKFVILGGGMVAGYAAKQLVELGLKSGDLTILSADDSLPYERPPLSKGFLAGRDSEASVFINPPEFYREHGIEVRLNCRVTAIDPAAKRLHFASGPPFGFERLIVATGAHPRKLDIPGADLAAVHYLRSLGDSKAIRRTAENAKRAVVVGSGFIGMEVAAVLAQKKIEVAMVMREDRIWKRAFTPAMSRFFEDYYTARGVRFLKSAELRELRGDGRVNTAVLGDGQTVSCDMLVAGIGVTPVTDLLAGSGIDVQDGVMVNEFLESSRRDIFAAGDVANYTDVLFGKRRRVEHWDNAVSQGQHCARVLMGERAAFKHVPYFFSDIFDLSYEFWGDPAGADATVHRGDLSGNSFSVWWLRESVLVAAFTMNRPDEERESAPQWIERKQRLSAAKLADASRAVAESVERG